MPNPGSSYQTVVGVQPGPNLTLTGNQQSNMGNQMQGMMVQYPPVQSYQVIVPMPLLRVLPSNVFLWISH